MSRTGSIALIGVFLWFLLMASPWVLGQDEDGGRLPTVRIGRSEAKEAELRQIERMRRLLERLNSDRERVRRDAEDRIMTWGEDAVPVMRQTMRTHRTEPWIYRAKEILETLIRTRERTKLDEEEKLIFQRPFRTRLLKKGECASERSYPFRGFAICDIGDIRIAMRDREYLGEGACSYVPIDCTGEKEMKGSHSGTSKEAGRKAVTTEFSMHYKDGETLCTFCGVRFVLRYKALIMQGKTVPFGRGKSVLFLDREGNVAKIAYAPRRVRR
jgi:hypothetical protein